MSKANRGDNKTKKFVLLATYAVAVLCLLAGLFLPLFNGKDLLALKLMEVLKSLLKKENSFAFAYPISLFGIEKVSFDFLAVAVLLYAVVTAVALIALVPVILSVLKKGKLAKKLYYGIEITAVTVLTLFFTAALFIGATKCYNMAIAFGGTAVALLVLCGMDKGKTATVKIGLFLLSAVSFIALFDIVGLISKELEFANAFKDKISCSVIGATSGADYLTLLFAAKFSDFLSEMPDFKNKLLVILAAATATAVLVNFFIDTVKLATKKDKKIGRLVDLIRWGIVFVLAAATLIIALVCKYTLGLMLIAILAFAAAALAITIIRFIFGIKKSRKKSSATVKNATANTAVEAPAAVEIPPVEETPVAEATADEITEADAEDPLLDDALLDETDPLLADEGNPSDDPLLMDDGETADDTDIIEEQPAGEDTTEQAVPTTPIPDDEGYIDPLLDEQYYSKAEEKQEEFATEDLEDVMVYKTNQDETYLVPDADTAIEEPAEAEEPATLPEEEHVEVVEEPVIEAELAQPVLMEEPEVQPEEPEEQPEEVAEEDIESALDEEISEEQPEIEEVPEAEEQTDAVRNPFREEIKPYNPYEKHNPFKNFEEPPYNPYIQQPEEQPAEVQPVKPIEQPVEPVKPIEQPVEPRPVEPVRPIERAPQPVRPLQPRSIIQEFKPVPPVNEQPPKEAKVYTLDTIYAGPVDDFIRKLSNDERIEFAKTFIEKVRGSLGAIPDYDIGGNNKKFFSCVFIYLGRIRGMVSDGLLNKMYTELDLL